MAVVGVVIHYGNCFGNPPFLRVNDMIRKMQSFDGPITLFLLIYYLMLIHKRAYLRPLPFWIATSKSLFSSAVKL